MASSRNRYDKEERYIVSSLEPSDNTNRIWKCKLCSENFDSVIKGAFHVWLYCSKSKIVSRWALVPTESIVKICAFLDPVSCGSMPEMYRRVQAEDDGNDNDDDESHTTEEDTDEEQEVSDIEAEDTLISKRTSRGEHTFNLARNSVVVRANRERIGGNPKAEAVPERETSNIDENDDHDDIPAEELEYSRHPPEKLKDTEDWYNWRTIHTRASDIIEAISQINGGQFRGRISQAKGEAILKLWNSDYSTIPEYKQYMSFEGLRARLNKDCRELNKMREKADAAERAQEAKKAQAAGNGKASLRGTKR